MLSGFTDRELGVISIAVEMFAMMIQPEGSMYDVNRAARSVCETLSSDTV